MKYPRIYWAVQHRICTVICTVVGVILARGFIS